MARALIGLGANLGDRERTLAAAIEQLAATRDTRLLVHSDWLRTSPVGGPAGQESFLDGAALVETRLAPRRLLDALLAIETALGRERSQRWAPRTLDLDLLLYDDQALLVESLELPHPGLAFRRFMLEPAAAIAPGMTHPRIGWTLDQLVKHLDSSANYLAIGGGDRRFRRALATEVARQAGATLVSDAAPPVQSAEQALELLKRRVERLAAAASASRIVSDFGWNDFPSHVGNLSAPGAESAIAAWRTATANVPPPRLLIVIDEDPKPPGDAADTAPDSLASVVLTQPGNGPFLRVRASTSFAQAVIEVSAACEAMQ